MQSRQDVAAALGVTDRHLCYVLFGRNERARYREFSIRKKNGGTRTISRPPGRLLWLQRQLYGLLRSRYLAKDCVHGFVPDRSIVSNAIRHTGRRFVVNVDLADFFPSIHIGRVIGVFRSHPFVFGDAAATVLAQICCRSDGQLPQGGAMSPLLSNLVCRGLDSDLLTFAQRHKIRYTRYADDLTFSSARPSLSPALVVASPDSVDVGQELQQVVSGHNFVINPSKLRVRTQSRRQEVTGITVNAFPNIPRDYVRGIEGAPVCMA